MPADPLFDRLARALAGRYSLIRELGQGGMATVYLGTDQKLGRRVAIKVLAPATRAYLGSDRFQREVLLAAQLSHPHIVPLFEADEADGLLFYVMEYVEGESLQDRISRKGPLPVEEAVRLATEVGDALEYAHDCGVIHRDVKPANILLSRGHAMVSDFGIAKLLEERGAGERSSLTAHGIAVGTAEYMSPEQASGDKHVDPRSDVYGLAAVLYEMLAGEPPFTGDSVQAVVSRVLNEMPRPIRALRASAPAHLERALMRALAKTPGDRPPSARAFIEMLTAPGPFMVATAERPEPVRPLWTSHPVRLLFVLAGLSVILFAIAFRSHLPRRAAANRTGQRDLLTAAPHAVARLLEGQDRFWHNDYDGAAVAYHRAIEADSDFALAYHRLSVVETWRWDYPAARQAVEAGLARRERLAPKWRELLEAQRHYVMRNADSAIVAFQGVTDDYASLLDGWYGLGEALYHFAGPAGHDPVSARGVLERVATQDSEFAPIFGHLVTLGIYAGDSVGAREALKHVQPQDREQRAAALAVDLAFGGPAAHERAVVLLDRADRSTVSLLVAWFGHGAKNLPLVDTIAESLLKPGRTPDDRVRGAQYRLVALAGQGRWSQAIAIWDSVAGGASFDRWIVQAYLAGWPAGPAAEHMFAWAQARMASGDAPDFARPLWEEPQQAFRALVHRASIEGDSAQVEALLNRLDAATPHADPSDPLPPALRAALRARLALLAADTSNAIRLLEQSVARSGEPYATLFPLLAFGPERWVLATLLGLRGDIRGARRWLASFSTTWSYGDVLFGPRVECLRKAIAEPGADDRRRGLRACR